MLATKIVAQKPLIPALSKSAIVTALLLHPGEVPEIEDKRYVRLDMSQLED